MFTYDCPICIVSYEFTKELTTLECEICGYKIVDNNKEVDNLDDIDNLSEINFLDDFPDIDSIECFEDLAIDENLDNKTDEIELKRLDFRAYDEVYLKNESMKNSFILEELDYEKGFAYAIKNIKIAPLNISNSIYDYTPIDSKLLLARFLYLAKKSRKWGVLALEEDQAKEPNFFMRHALHLLFEGYEYKTIKKNLLRKKDNFKHIYLLYGSSRQKDIYISHVMKNFDAIIDAIICIYSYFDIVEIYNIMNIRFENVSEYKTSLKKYEEINKPYFLLNEKERMLPTGKRENTLELLKIFNKKRDNLQPIEIYILEDIEDLGNRLLSYSLKAQSDMILSAATASLQDPNALLRHLSQLSVIGNSPNDVWEYGQKYKEEKKNLLEKLHNESFIMLFEREVDLIIEIILGIMAGNSLKIIQHTLIAYCPEIVKFNFDKAEL